MSLASRSIRGAVFLSASTITNIVVGFIGGIVLARLLGPAILGTFAMANTVSSFVDLRGKLQLEQKFLSDRDERREYFDSFFTLNIALSSLSLLFLLLAALAAVHRSRPDLALCLVAIGVINLIDPMGTCIRFSMERQVVFGRVALVQSLVYLTQFVTTLVCAIAGLGLWSLLLGLGVSTLLGVALFLRIAPQRPSLRLNRALAYEFLSYGIKYGLVYATSSIVLTQFDSLIIGLMGGTTALGFYDRAHRTSLWPTLLISASLARIALPTYAKLQDDPLRLSKAFSIVLWVLFTFATPLALVLLVTAQDLVPALYGDRWLPSVPILQLLAAFALSRPLWDDLVSILIATKRPALMARLVLVQAIILVLLSVPLTRFFGGVGTAISVGLTFLISTGFLLYFAHIHLRIPLLETVVLPLLNNALAVILYLVMRWFLPVGSLVPLLRLLVEVSLLLGLYGLVVLITSRQSTINRLRYIIQLARS